jgi:serine/threonine protein kinase
MGVVYMAEQREPVVRKVALKIIKAGMETRQVVARFEAELQALAIMDHPNIVKVFDGGATENPLTRPSDTLSPKGGERDRARGRRATLSHSMGERPEVRACPPAVLTSSWNWCKVCPSLSGSSTFVVSNNFCERWRLIRQSGQRSARRWDAASPNGRRSTRPTRMPTAGIACIHAVEPGVLGIALRLVRGRRIGPGPTGG